LHNYDTRLKREDYHGHKDREGSYQKSTFAVFVSVNRNFFVFQNLPYENFRCACETFAPL